MSAVTKTLAAADPNFHIYLGFGQSNMYGAGPIEEPELTVDPRFQMLSTVTCGDHELGQWYDAIPPLSSCAAGVGPVDYFGRTLVEEIPEIRVGAVVVAIPGCDIQLFEKNNYMNYVPPDWMIDLIKESGNNPYARLVNMAKLAQQYGVIKGILLHQGETNNGQEDWPLRVKAIYDDLIEDLNLNPEETPLLVGEVVQESENGTCSLHNTVIQKIPEVIPNSYVISSEGLKQQGDGFHFTTEAYRTFGKRFADVMLNILKEKEAAVEVDAPVDSEIDSADEAVDVDADVVEEEDSVSDDEPVIVAPAPPTSGKKLCWSEALGYPCCPRDFVFTPQNVVSTMDGEYGVQDDAWCGIVF